MLSWPNQHPSKIRCLLIKKRRTRITIVNKFGDSYTLHLEKIHVIDKPFSHSKFNSRANDMSFDAKGQRMIHASVNTDPLKPLNKAMVPDDKKIHYGLKERNIPHIKINEMKELKVWYDFGEKIGEGGFGTVMTVIDKGSSKQWAMKCVSKSIAGDRLTLVQQEIQVLKMIRHPHIIYLDKIFESAKFVYMVLEKLHDFAKIYQERKPFPEKVAKKIVTELVDAVAYLHKYGNFVSVQFFTSSEDIVHRDIKVENILLGDNPSDPLDEYYIKLTDFGLSIVKYGQGFESCLKDYCGTPQYMAPEIITLRSYTQMCDMWSVGVIVYMLVVGNYPFYAKDEKKFRDLICTEAPSFQDCKISNEVKDLILLLLVKEPVNRLTATEVLRHPWLLSRKLSKAMDFNILEKMKEWKSEMKVKTGAASDWAVMGSEEMMELDRQNKQALNLPKTNIFFDRSKKSLRRNSLKNSKESFPKRQSN